MEIIDYLRIARSRAWILIALPLLAAGGVIAVTLSQPVKYSAKATVDAPALVGGIGANQYTGADGPKSFDSNFAAALTTPAIVNEVAQQTGVKASTIKSGLSAVPLGSSTTLGPSTIQQVTYTTPKKKTADTVVEHAASDTMVFLFSTQEQLAKANVVSAQGALNTAEAALTSFESQTGLAQPDHTYDLLQQEINSLQEQQLQDQASGSAAAAAGLNAAIAAKQVELTALSPQVEKYLALVDAKNAAITNLNNVQQTAYQAENQFSAAAPASTITVSRPQRVSRLSGLILTAGPAAAAALFLAVGLVFVLELLSRRRRNEPAPATEDTPSFDLTDLHGDGADLAHGNGALQPSPHLDDPVR